MANWRNTPGTNGTLYRLNAATGEIPGSVEVAWAGGGEAIDNGKAGSEEGNPVASTVTKGEDIGSEGLPQKVNPRISMPIGMR